MAVIDPHRTLVPPRQDAQAPAVSQSPEKPRATVRTSQVAPDPQELKRVEADRKELTAQIQALKAAGFSPKLIDGVGGSDAILTINALSLSRDSNLIAFEGYPAQILGYRYGSLPDLSPAIASQRANPELVAFSLRQRAVSKTHTEITLYDHLSPKEPIAFRRVVPNQVLDLSGKTSLELKEQISELQKNQKELGELLKDPLAKQKLSQEEQRELTSEGPKLQKELAKELLEAQRQLSELPARSTANSALRADLLEALDSRKQQVAKLVEGLPPAANVYPAVTPITDARSAADNNVIRQLLADGWKGDVSYVKRGGAVDQVYGSSLLATTPGFKLSAANNEGFPARVDGQVASLTLTRRIGIVEFDEKNQTVNGKPLVQTTQNIAGDQMISSYILLSSRAPDGKEQFLADERLTMFPAITFGSSGAPSNRAIGVDLSAFGGPVIDRLIEATVERPVTQIGGRTIYSNIPDQVSKNSGALKTVADGVTQAERLFGREPGAAVDSIYLLKSNDPNASFNPSTPKVIKIQDQIIGKSPSDLVGRHETFHALDHQTGVVLRSGKVEEFHRATLSKNQSFFKKLDESSFYGNAGDAGHSAANPAELVASFLNSIVHPSWKDRVALLSQGDPAFKKSYLEGATALLEQAKKSDQIPASAPLISLLEKRIGELQALK